MKIRGFTLAEIMIALSVIGIITAILLPVAMQSVPNENVMKFKKGHATLFKVINELVTSGEYYTPGDLGAKPDGTLVDGKHDGDYAYFCKTFGDIISVKNSLCDESATSADGYITAQDFLKNTTPIWMDTECKKIQSEIKTPIQTSDNIFYYLANPTITFASSFKALVISSCSRSERDSWCDEYTDFDALDDSRAIGIHKNSDGFQLYSVHFCMDIDGLNQGEDPFGYGIRADGKILTGARADEWLKKDIQSKE